MTCIVALKTKDKSVWMGGDRQSTAGTTIHILNQPKVVRNGSYLLGSTGTARYSQILAYGSIPPPPVKDDKRLYDFMVCDFANFVRQVMASFGHLEKYNEIREDSMGATLIGVHGRIFHLNCDFAVTETKDPYIAIGSGQDIAMGALAALTKVNMEPAKKLTIALTASEHHCVGISRPFDLLHLPKSVR